MLLNNIANYLLIGLAILVAGSIYLIIEGIKVQKFFAESVVGKLVKILVLVLLIELYSLGIVSYAFLLFYPNGALVLLPITALWIISLGFAIAGVRSAKQQVKLLIK